MTILPPTPPRVDMGNFPYRLDGYTNTTPFTHRDGMTFIRKLEAIQKWLMSDLVPHIDDSISIYVDAFNGALGDIQKYMEGQQVIIDDKVSDFIEKAAAAVKALNDLLESAKDQIDADKAAAEAARVGAEAASAEAERWAGQSKDDQDQNVSELVKDRSTLTYAAFVRRLGVFVDDFGAKGDGTNDDAAIQAALNAIDAVGAGTLYFSPGKVYGYVNTLETPARDVTWEGQGATLKKLYTGTQSSTSIVNKVKDGEKGYGSSGKNLTFRNLRLVGDYTAPGILDFSMAFNHVDGIRFDGVVWEQGNVHAHYVDLAGCRFVEFNAYCRMVGANPPAGREYVEAIQIDQSTYAGAGWKNWPRTSFDGLPTKNVTVDGMSFMAMTVNGTSYPCPNPIGSHGAAMLGDNGYYEDIKFINNRIEGWTRIIAIGAGAAYGWVHFRGVRNLDISNNHFKYTGPAGLAAISAVINVVATTQAVADSDVAADSPVNQTLATPRYSRNVTIKNNKFTGFANGPTSDDYGLITVNSIVSGVIADNTSDGANSTVVKTSSSGTADGPRISGNAFYSGSDKPVINAVASTASEIANNVIHMTNPAGTGIREYGSNGDRVSDNKTRGGLIGIDALNNTNTTIDSNTILGQANAAIRVGTSAASDTAFDTLVFGNRSRSTEPGSIGLAIGSNAQRTRRYGNFWSTNTKTLDNGTGTTNTAYQDND